jgi:hypothetical protein
MSSEDKKKKNLIRFPTNKAVAFHKKVAKRYADAHVPILNLPKMIKEFPQLFKSETPPEELGNTAFVKNFTDAIEKLSRKKLSPETKEVITQELQRISKSVGSIIKAAKKDQKQIEEKTKLIH